jgi:hypothetical protein
MDFPPQLLKNLAIYQDVVVAGRTVRSGQRDCPARWALLDPHLPRAGAILDVGSNFGWFGLQICQTRPECVVASLEADLRSAEVQRQVLASNDCRRVCLLTARANARLVQRWESVGQRFDAVLCLAVLHWMADHRQFLTALGRIAGRLLVEQPDPREAGAGVETIRRQIGAIGAYLADVFPDRPVQRLAQLASHRDGRYPRELWLVAEPAGWPTVPAPGLDVNALLDAAPGWPARSWWAKQAATVPHTVPTQDTLLFTPRGLRGAIGPDFGQRVRRLPERTAFLPGRRLLLAGRRAVGNVLRRFRLR